MDLSQQTFQKKKENEGERIGPFLRPCKKKKRGRVYFEGRGKERTGTKGSKCVTAEQNKTSSLSFLGERRTEAAMEETACGAW